MQSEPRNARVSVWPLSVSLAATPEIDVSFSSSGYLDVSVPRVPFLTLWIGVRITEVLSVRFPHSDIHGSLVICTSPWLFAAYHVFRRLLVPRHPPCALLCLTSRCIALQHFVLLKKAFLSFYWIFWFVNSRMSWYWELIFINFLSSKSICMKFSRCYESSLSCEDSVETERFELLTPCLQGRCSPNWATPPSR